MKDKLRNTALSSKERLEPVVNSVCTNREWVDVHGFQPSVVRNASEIMYKRLKAWFTHENQWETQTNGNFLIVDFFDIFIEEVLNSVLTTFEKKHFRAYL